MEKPVAPSSRSGDQPEATREEASSPSGTGDVLTLLAPEKVLMRRCSICARDLPAIGPEGAFHRRRHYVRAGVRAACKDCTREANRRARAAGKHSVDPRKQRVRRLTHAAIARGELVPEPCEVCGELNVQAHHPSYEGDDAHVEVRWLCRKHHALLHGQRAWTNQLELFPVPF